METISAAPASEQLVANNAPNAQLAMDSKVGNAPQGQPQVTGDRGGPEDSFTSIDPKTLAPELQPIYKNLQRDYTAKSQSVAEKMRQFEAASKKAELYDQVSSDPRFVEYWNGLNNQQKAEAMQDANPENLPISQEEFAKAFESPQNFAAFIKSLQQESQKEIQTVKAELTVTKAEKFIESFKAKEEYKNYDKYEPLMRLYMQSYPAEKPETKYWEKSLKEAYSFVDKMYNETFEEGKKAGLTRIQEKAAYSTESPSNGAAQIYPGGDPKNLSVKEAVELARKGIRVPK